MKSFLGNFILFLLLVLPSTLLLLGNGNAGGLVAYADNDDHGDAMEGEEDDDANVETEDAGEDEGAAVTETEKTDEEEEEEVEQLKPSEDADAVILFTKPVDSTDLPAGQLVRFLVGFTNTGEKTFTVETLEASFRYPQDYSFYIQNFTTATYNAEVEGNKQATFEYGFTPSETFASRPFGLTILLNYKDDAGTQYQHAVYNDTVNIVEPDEGLDGETFFMYLFLVAIAILLVVVAQQFLGSITKKRLIKPRQPVEMGTQNSDIDFDWIPKEALQMNTSPKRSPKQSPRQRRSKRTAGSGEE
ncbi:translocon-associated protein subunit alpha-like [Ylistrum balloti]|uniref:translocon-associated protein subunit alpha-like n=1 Tax=Ylistrum balloti TaxID=509963 RepID=UPI002905C7D5|nr:translocon-associated protein subunit alpha-like [Ylistrum balloti]